MNSQYLSLWQNAIADVFDNKKHIETMDRFYGQAISGVEELSKLMQQSPHWDIFGQSFTMFNPVFGGFFDLKKHMNDYMQLFGFVTIEEYRSLVKKYEELKKERDTLEKTEAGHQNKITEMKKKIESQNKNKSDSKKSIDDHKAKLAEQKTLNSTLKKELTAEKKNAASVEKELKGIKEQLKTLQKDIAEKEKLLKGKKPAKA